MSGVTFELEVAVQKADRRGRKWLVVCPVCGAVGRNTTEVYGRQRAELHVAEKHRAVVSRAGQITLDEMGVGRAG